MNHRAIGPLVALLVFLALGVLERRPALGGQQVRSSADFWTRTRPLA